MRHIATDIARGYDWPAEFNGRVLNNDFAQRWHGREDEQRAQAEAGRADYLAAVAEGRSDEVGVFVGEAIGLMRHVSPVADIMDDIVAQAAELLARRAPSFVT